MGYEMGVICRHCGQYVVKYDSIPGCYFPGDGKWQHLRVGGYPICEVPEPGEAIKVEGEYVGMFGTIYFFTSRGEAVEHKEFHRVQRPDLVIESTPMETIDYLRRQGHSNAASFGYMISWFRG